LGNDERFFSALTRFTLRGRAVYTFMFDALSEKLTGTARKLRGYGKIRESNIEDALRDVRLSLLEADVHFRVVKEFVDAVKVRALGEEVLGSVSPSQQFIKIVHDELVKVLGGENTELNLQARPPIPILMVGLQGSGKTTTSGKLALHLKKLKRKPFLVPVDVQRPAAIEQLKTLGRQIDIPVYPTEAGDKPVKIVRKALKEAELQGYDTVIFDTAGRLAIDEALMKELVAIRDEINPHEILFVADAMTGQDAVKTAEAFNKALDFTGVVLTKMEGDARGGAALSIKHITGKPIKFAGMGEKLTDLQPFHPDRVANRMLDMGDIVSLVEKAQGVIDVSQAQDLEQKMRTNSFTLEDFLSQLQTMKKLGSIEGILKMIPGTKQLLKGAQEMGQAEGELKKTEAIIQSMTKKERRDHTLLNGSRRKRIAQGSGTQVADVNRLIKSYLEMRKMMARVTKMGMGNVMKGLMRGGKFPSM
jgi:signal recognition particle subunit SRP54